MPFFGTVDGPGSSDSSGDADQTPKTPTNDFFPPKNGLTPSPHYSRSRFHFNAEGASRQNLRNIWQEADSMSNTLPHVVFPESPSSSGYSTGTHSRMVNASAQSCDRAETDASDWETELEKLQLRESILQAAANVPQASQPPSCDPRETTARVYDTRETTPSYDTRETTPSIYNTRETTPTQPVADPVSHRPLSIWSSYGSQNDISQSNFMPMHYQNPPHSTPRPVRNSIPMVRSRALSETSFNSPASFHPIQHRFLSQTDPPVPVRMGQSQYSNHIAPRAEPSYPVPFYLQPRNQGFLPMQAISTDRPANIPRQVPSLGIINPVPSTRFSDRYHGMHTESNASAEYLAPEENASLWITNLPPDVTHHELLGQIRNIGRIWCCYINGPDGMKHTTAAAKVVFFQPRAAQSLLQHSITDGLQVRGFRAKVTQNRIKTPATIPRGGSDSRVLIVTGQTHFVNEKTLSEYFGLRFVFQLDEVKELIKGGGRAVLEFRFGSYRCQAQMGKISLEKDRPLGFEKAEFGEDPCEVGETYSSHAIALQRIKGIGI